ncbi:pentapeptide repeat-containing protein [Chloroflexi bacterium TSY]|nr:pentapeptide repeat-containing protein [Chloroflexi bacterium TSY]
MYMPKLTDIRLIECSLANTNCEHDCSSSGIRRLSIGGTKCHRRSFPRRAISRGDLQLARFRFCSFKSVIFDRCNLKEANFQGERPTFQEV